MEFMLPPATRQKDAERLARKGLERLARELQLPSPAPSQLRNVQPTHGSLAAIFGVPRHLAMQWLRGSGCGGLYLRPFWTENSSEAVSRGKFELLWLRGKLAEGPRIWEAVKGIPSVVGLLPGDKDVAVRVTAGCPPEALQAVQAQVQFVLEDRAAQFKRAVPGQRWWRLGPLTEEECWRMQDLVAATGLVPLRGELRVARMGPFRRAVYFAAAGEPTAWSLDDGSWSASEARLSHAEPPPRRQPKSSAAPAPRQSPGSLPATSVWAGPRLKGPAAAAPGPRQVGPKQGSGPQPVSESFPPLPAPAFPASTQVDQGVSGGPRSQSRGRREPRAPRTSLETRMDQLMSLLQQQTEELRQLRLENASLRAQLQGVQVHQPYGSRLVPQPASGSPSPATESTSHVPSQATRDGSPTAVTPRQGVQLEEDVTMTPPKLTHPSEKGISSPDPKRPRALVASGADDV